MTQKHTNNRMQKKPNDSGQKYGNQKNKTKKKKKKKKKNKPTTKRLNG